MLQRIDEAATRAKGHTVREDIPLRDVPILSEDESHNLTLMLNDYRHRVRELQTGLREAKRGSLHHLECTVHFMGEDLLRWDAAIREAK